MNLILWVVAIALMVLGLVGVVLPVVPGALLVFAGMAVAAWADGFVHIGWGRLTVLALLAIASYVIDFVAGMTDRYAIRTHDELFRPRLF